MNRTTAVCNAMLGALNTALTGGSIELRTGSKPASASAAATGTLLARLTDTAQSWSYGSSTHGLTFDAASGGVLSKAAAQTWSGTVLADGTVGYARFVSASASETGSNVLDTISRLDLSVSAGGGGECRLSHIDLVTGEPVSCSGFTYTLPTTV